MATLPALSDADPMAQLSGILGSILGSGGTPDPYANYSYEELLALDTGPDPTRYLANQLSLLATLEGGKYAKPVAGVNATELSTLNGLPGLQFVTNTGRGASTSTNPTGFVPYLEDTEYRVVDERGKDNVIYSGTGQEGLLGAYNATQNLSATGGTKANWIVEARSPGAVSWYQVADDDPKGSGVGEIVGGLLPLATLAIPGLNVATGALVASGLGGIGAEIAGRDPLTGAVMGGLSSLGGSVLGPAIQSAGGAATTLGTAVGTGLGTTAGGLVTGQNLQDAVMGGIASGALSYIAGELFNNVTGEPVTDADLAQLQTDFDAAFGTGTPGTSSFSPDTGITVTSSANPRVNAAVNVMLRTGGGSVGDPEIRDLTPEEFEEAQRVYDEQVASNDIVVSATPANTTDLLNTGVPAGIDTSILNSSQLQNAQQQPQDQYDSTSSDIVVEGEPSSITDLLNTAGPLTGVLGTGTLINSILDSPQLQNAQQQLQDPSGGTGLTGIDVIDDIIKYASLAGLGIDVAGSLLGGGSGSGGTATPYTPVLGAVPQFTRSALVPYAGDYETYGTRPEHAFFENMTGVLPTTTTPTYTPLITGPEAA